MDKKFLLKFAWKNIWQHKMRSLLTVFAMIIGVSAIVFLVAFAFGIENQVSKEITGGNAYELIDVGTGNSQIIKLNRESIEKIRALNNVKDIKTVANLASKVRLENDETIDASFFATSSGYMDLSGVQIYKGKNIGEGEGDSNANVVVNTSLLERIGIGVESGLGQFINSQIIIPKEIVGNGEAKMLEEKKFTIVGITKEQGAPSIYAEANSLHEEGVQTFSQAKITIENKNNIDVTRKQIENLGFKTEYVGETVAQVEQIFAFFKIILGSFGLIALVVASLGMFNTLTISLLERTREVALLKILGMKRRDILKIFLSESIVMGFFGGSCGILFGILASKIANSLLNKLAVDAGGDPVLLFAFPAWFIMTIFAFSILVALITGFYPARRATKINALDVLRYE